MNVLRGHVWMADLNPIRGSEQAGTRPIMLLQNNAINPYTRTVLAVPCTTNLRRAALPSCVLIQHGDGGLVADSVALGHQVRVLDTYRLIRLLRMVQPQTLTAFERCMLFTMGIS